jgi:hypothetical protein
MSLTELPDHLNERFRLPTGAEHLLLGRLSVFAAGFDLTAAEAVTTGRRIFAMTDPVACANQPDMRLPSRSRWRATRRA